MKILALDTTATSCSCAILIDGVIRGEARATNGLTHSEQLLPLVLTLSESCGISDFSEFDVFACNVGPGSFTGVRIGVATIKGLAFGKNKPCVALSTLESLAFNLKDLPGLIVPVMDARRNQVYTALFESDGKKLTRKTDDLAISLEDLKFLLNEKKDKPIYFVGDGYALAKNAFEDSGLTILDTPSLLIQQNAASSASLAQEKIKQNEIVSDLTLSPLYLRLSQAERERNEKNT